MTLFFTMLPVYLVGNLHCIGMCGPLVAMIGQHRYRMHYFAGRLLSFALAGAIAGGLGAVLGAVLSLYHLSALTSFLFGAIILAVAMSSFTGVRLPGGHWISAKLAHAGRHLTPLMMQDRRWPTFLFGFFTITLPCGQTVLVYSACAVAGDALVGLYNGALFALITSPSLLVAMHAHRLLPGLRGRAPQLLGIAGMIVGILALLRGFADLDIIPHLVISHSYHIVVY